MDAQQRLASALEDIHNYCFGDGDYVLTIQFGIDTDSEIWADAKLAPASDPQNDLSVFCGEADTLEDIIIGLAENLNSEVEQCK